MTNQAAVAHGPALVGICVSLFVLGINAQQFVFYFSTVRSRDHLFIPIFVGILAVLEVLNTVLNCHWIYDALVTGFGDTEQLKYYNWSSALHPVLMGFTICAVQLFFAWRIHILLHKPLIVIVVGISALVSAGLGTACTVLFSLNLGWKDFTNKDRLVAMSVVWYCIAIMGDAIITISLTWYLHQRRAALARSDTRLSKIMKLTVQNGLLTTIWALLDLIFFLGVPGGAHWFFLHTIPKLYINAVLSSLNARSGWSYGTVNSYSNSGPKHAPRRNGEIVSLRPSSTPPAEVFVSVETHELQDVESKNTRQWSNPAKSHTSENRSINGQST